MSTHNHGIAAGAVVGRDHVSNRVRHRPQLQVDQFLVEISSTLGFAKWRRGDFREADLIRFDVRFVIGDIAKGLTDTRIREQFVNLLAHYLISKGTGSDSITGCDAILPMTLYLPGVTTLTSLS